MIAGTLRAGRRLAESLMDDTVSITREGGEPVWDEASGEFVTPRTVVYSGKARIRQPRAFGNRVDEQGAAVTVQELTLSLPVDGSAGVRVDDVAEVTASTHDAGLVGLALRVTDLHTQTHSTARRFGVEVES